MKEKTLYLISTAGFLMIAVAMLIPLIKGPAEAGEWFKYLYAVGAVIMFICSLLSPYRGKDIKLKRLFRIQSWGAIMFCAGAFFLFWEGGNLRDWIAFTLAGAIIRAYSNFAIVARQRKLAEGDNH